MILQKDTEGRKKVFFGASPFNSERFDVAERRVEQASPPASTFIQD